MNENILQLKLACESARWIHTPHAILGLQEAIVYFKTAGKILWQQSLERVAESFFCHPGRKTWNFEYAVADLDEASVDPKALAQVMGDDDNYIMPVYMPDCEEKYYLVGHVEMDFEIEIVANCLIKDHSRISALSLSQIFVRDFLKGPDYVTRFLHKVVADLPESTTKTDWEVDVADDSDVDADLLAEENTDLSRGPKKPDLFATIGGYNPTKNHEPIKDEYLMSHVHAFCKELKLLRESDNVEAKNMLIRILLSLEKSQLYCLCYELVKNTSEEVFTKIAEKVIDRETMGKNSKYDIICLSADHCFVPKGDGNGKFTSSYHLFLKERGVELPTRISREKYMELETTKKLLSLSFPNAESKVLYVVRLINKVQNIDEKKEVSWSKRSKFFTVFRFLYANSTDNECLESYNKLDKRCLCTSITKGRIQKQGFPPLSKTSEVKSSDIEYYRKGRLSDQYTAICGRLSEALVSLGENPSPYLVGEKLSLALPPDHIQLPASLLDLIKRIPFSY